MTHLLYLAASRLPSRHANSVQVAHMLAALCRHAEQVTAVLPATWRGLWAHLCGRLLAPYGLPTPPNLRLRFRGLLHPSRFEALASRGLPQAELALTRSAPAALALCSGPVPVLFESHDPARDEAKAGRARLVAALSQGRHGLVAISQAVAQTYRAAGLPEDRILVAPDAVDLTRFTQARGGGLARLFGPRILERPVALYCGSLQPGKGARFLARLAPALPEAHLAVVGGSPQESQDLAQAHAAANLFVHPAVPHAQVPDLLADAAVLVLPYTGTDRIAAAMSPLKLFEALAAGHPIVAADLPVLREVLTPETALFFPPGDAAACAATIRAALGLSPADRTAWQARARAAAWSWDDRARRILQWWQQRRW